MEASTKSQIESWIQEQIEDKGLDYRAGYLVKFRDSSDVYWKNTKDGKPVRCG